MQNIIKYPVKSAKYNQVSSKVTACSLSVGKEELPNEWMFDDVMSSHGTGSEQISWKSFSFPNIIRVERHVENIAN